MNNLDYVSGMISTWNKFCFTGGMVLASVTLPGANDVVGTEITVRISSCAADPPCLSRTLACRFALAHSSWRRRTNSPLQYGRWATLVSISTRLIVHLLEHNC
jgi:hypothetical protein